MHSHRKTQLKSTCQPNQAKFQSGVGRAFNHDLQAVLCWPVEEEARTIQIPKRHTVKDCSLL